MITRHTSRAHSPAWASRTFSIAFHRMLRADERRVYALTAQFPLVVWGMISMLAVLAMGLMGYDMGLCGSRRSLATIPLGLALAIVIFLIADLDRPLEGFIRTNRQAQRELTAVLNRE